MSTEKPLPPDFEALAPQDEPALIGFALSFAQTGALLAVLGAAPYRDVAGLVETIRQQAEAEFQRQSLVAQFAEMPTDAMGRA